MKKALTATFLSVCLGLFVFACFFSGGLFYSENNYTKEYIEYLNTQDKSIYGDLVPLAREVETDNKEVEGSFLDSYYCLRDEIMIYTTSQANYGICWAHAASLSLETLYAKTTREFIDLSESWVSLATKKYHDNHNYTSYVVGGGGNIDYYHNSIREYGLMLESDFPLSDYYFIDSSNYTSAFDMYSKYSFRDLGFDLIYKDYTIQSTMKEHLTKYGSLYTTINSSYIMNEKNLNSTTTESNHAVSIIGWDDEYQAEGWAKPGAWIALNSWGDKWGEDGTFYISYDDTLANSVMHGYVVEKDNSVVDLYSSNSNYENRISLKYNSISNSSITKTFENKNIFSSTEKIELLYSFDEAKFTQADVSISKDEVFVQNDLSNFFVDIENGIVHIEAENLKPGTYKLTFNLKTTDGEITTVIKTFFVFDGLEIGYIKLHSTATAAATNYDEATNYYSNFNSYNGENLYCEIHTPQYAYLYLYLPTYSYLTSSEIVLDSGLSCNKTTTSFNIYSDKKSDYASGIIAFNFKVNNNANMSPEYNAKIILKGKSEITKTIHLKIKNTTFSYQNLTYTHVNVQYYGNVENKIIPSMLSLSSNRKTYLPKLQKGSSTFGGYYTSSDFSAESKVPMDEIGYYLTDSHAYTTNGFNYATKNSGFNEHINYIYLYAKWTNNEVVVTFIYESQTEEQTIPYGADATYPTSIISDKGFEIVWNKNFSNVTGDLVIEGSKKLKPASVDTLFVNDSETNILSSTYNPYWVHTLSVKASHELEDVSFTYSWKYCPTSEKIPNKTLSSFSDLNFYNISKASQSGKYIAEIKAKKDNYERTISTSEFIVNIDKAETIIDTIGISKEYTYNGNFQTISGAKLNHEESDIQYINNSFKDVGSGTKTIIIYAEESENYKSSVLNFNITIHPANVTIKIDNKRGAVFSEKMPLTYEIKAGSVYNDDLQLELSTEASMLIAGNFDITAISKNSNYNVTIINGVYTVYVEGLSLALIISLSVFLSGVCALITYFIIINVNMKKRIKSEKIDQDVDNL